MRDLGNVDLNLLVPLQALLRHKNVSRAAESLGLTQPAMSNSLRRLRSLLGDPLLVREGNRYELTARALVLQERVDALLGEVADGILQRPVFDPAESNRRFVVGASASTAVTALHPVMMTLGTTAPGISFKLVDLPRDPGSLLHGHEVDLLLVPEHLAIEQPRDRLYRDEWVLVAAEGNPKTRAPLTLASLAELPFGVYEQDGLRVHAVQFLSAQGVQVRARFVCDNFLTLLHMVEDSDLVAVVQTSIARRYAARNGLVMLDSPIPFLPFGIDLVWNPLTADDPACVWLKERFHAVHRQPIDDMNSRL